MRDYGDAAASNHRIRPLQNAPTPSNVSSLRFLQQHFSAAIVLVHHTRKSSSARYGQTLRGSSDLHAWGDSNLYLSHNSSDHSLSLAIEHRAARSDRQLRLQLSDHPHSTALSIR